MSVLDGGDGSTSGGRSERSRESGDLLPDDARERCGDGTVACMFAIIDVARKDVLDICRVSSRGELKSNAATACVLYQSSPSDGGLWFQLPHATERCSASISQGQNSGHFTPASMSHLSCDIWLPGPLHCSPLILNACWVKGSPDLGGRVNNASLTEDVTMRDTGPESQPRRWMAAQTQPQEDQRNSG
jgi:hypothetical protein